MLKIKDSNQGGHTDDRKKEAEAKSAEKKGELGPAEAKIELAAPHEKKELGHEEHKMLHAPGREKELEERLIRLQAEFENYKKRVAKENEMMREKAAADAMLKLLSIMDDFDMAIAHMDKAPHKEFKHGVELIYAKLLDTLKKEGVVEMKAVGESFDPYMHDALRTAEGKEGKIVEVVQKGYFFRGKVLRHAKVAVGKEGETKEKDVEERGCEEVD